MRCNADERALEPEKYTLTDGPADSEPRHIHGEVTIVAAELDPSPRCQANARNGGPWRVGVDYWAVVGSPCSLRKTQCNPKLTGRDAMARSL
jgi:hypothetical protein